jgi:hydroxymethylpyrimidine pyrophosphatase-like HAD family hydrolase
MCVKRIAAILSDYDGTLCPTDSVKNKAGTIPEKLEQVLWSISRLIPVCIISSKDYHFLYPRTKFARVFSCIMGIETISFGIDKGLTNENQGAKIKSSSNKGKEICSNISYGIGKSRLLPHSRKALHINSDLLSRLAENIELEFRYKVIVERKFTSERQYLAGITIDYRHLKDWRSYKKILEPSLKEMILAYQPTSTVSIADLYLLTYSSHPFMDMYALYCDKGMAYDFVTSEILKLTNEGRDRARGTLYLGDSDNDNPAFERADISIGINSDERLEPKLNSRYNINFDRLYIFLNRLLHNRFVFSEGLLYE